MACQLQSLGSPMTSRGIARSDGYSVPRVPQSCTVLLGLRAITCCSPVRQNLLKKGLQSAREVMQ